MGWFITFEGTEGSGKSTQIERLAGRLRKAGREVVALREPGGTALGERIRELVKHFFAGGAMAAETELLLICAARAQLVREVIRPALAAGKCVLCDRFYDSTTAYQGYGRQLDLRQVQAIIDFAVGDARPDLTLVLHVPLEVSEARRLARGRVPARDRMEEAGREFFARVEEGYRQIAAAEPQRVKWLDATGSVEAIEEAIWRECGRLPGLIPG
ncbi:MAG: dTMP kinase [Verrucomicrobiae bacterium]|nr:dTMP kinase [Verrucomicrobiae bacterium]